jgi:hypothetical protein
MENNNEITSNENTSVATPKKRLDLANELSQRVDPGKIASAKPVFTPSETVTEVKTNPDPKNESPKVEPTPKTTEGPKFRELTEEEKKQESNSSANNSQQQSYNMPPEMVAVMMVSTVDMVQQTLLSFIHKKKILTDRDAELIESGVPKPGVSYDIDSEEEALRLKLERHERIAKQLGFTEEETKHLVDVTAVYAKTKNLQMSPETALLISFGSVLAQRIGVIIKKS